jgi:hypothetical protein
MPIERLIERQHHPRRRLQPFHAYWAHMVNSSFLYLLGIHPEIPKQDAENAD